MFVPASSEFVALCKSQIALLTQGLGSSLSVVYLTGELVEGNGAKLIPVVAYPETAVVWEDNLALPISPETSTEDPKDSPAQAEHCEAEENPSLQNAGGLRSATPTLPVNVPLVESLESWNEQNLPFDADPEDKGLVRNRQMVLPLIQEGVVMGLLVTSREDRAWNEGERSQIERIAHTIAIACLLDRRQSWLGEQLREQQRLEAERHELLDNLLHQLRSPLTALRTFGKLLLKRLLEPDPNRQFATSILRESDRVQELLQQMNEAIFLGREDSVPDMDRETPYQPPRLERRSPQLLLPASGLEACSVPEVLEPLVLSARAIASDRGLQLDVEIPPQVPPVRANPRALREVLSNLIDNGLKYTPAGGRIAIHLGQQRHHHDREQLAIAISDTGPGIPPEDLERLFQRYYRGVQAQSDIPGTGLGLAIARELVRDMEGDIEVFSPAKPEFIPTDSATTPSSSPAPGTTFIVWLPIETDP